MRKIFFQIGFVGSQTAGLRGQMLARKRGLQSSQRTLWVRGIVNERVGRGGWRPRGGRRNPRASTSEFRKNRGNVHQIKNAVHSKRFLSHTRRGTLSNSNAIRGRKNDSAIADLRHGGRLVRNVKEPKAKMARSVEGGKITESFPCLRSAALTLEKADPMHLRRGKWKSPGGSSHK